MQTVAKDEGIIAELSASKTKIAGPGHSQYEFATLGELYEGLSRVYQLGASLPDTPLLKFLDKTKDLPKNTEAERLLVQ